MRRLYGLLLLLALPIALLVLQRAARKLGDRGRVGERFGRVAPIDGGVEVWLHAASFGEVQAATPLVDALLLRHGDGRIGVTTMTATGAALLRQRWGARVHQAYVPFDLPWLVARFLDRWQPQRAIVMESELWPNLFRALAERRIPLLVANARMSPRSRARYARLGGFVRQTIACADAIAAQAPHDADSYRALGAGRVEITGNLKFDCVVPDAQLAAGRALRAALGAQRPAWIAASTHEGEEAAALAAHRRLLEAHADALLILVPRHPQRFDSVAKTIERAGLDYTRRSQSVAIPDSRFPIPVLLGDSMGEMFCYLAASDLAFVGGSLVDIGGHNVLEPAALGLPVLFGPHMHNQKTAGELLLQAGGAQQIADADDLGAALLSLLGDPARMQRIGQAARAALTAHQGATRRVLQLFDRIA
jgi:3-deoxy-D-manno-octulosonic-acid transferase